MKGFICCLSGLLKHRVNRVAKINIREGFEININSNQKNERSLSEVLSKKSYEKVFPIIEHVMDKEIITPKEVEAVILGIPLQLQGPWYGLFTFISLPYK